MVRIGILIGFAPVEQIWHSKTKARLLTGLLLLLALFQANLVAHGAGRFAGRLAGCLAFAAAAAGLALLQSAFVQGADMFQDKNLLHGKYGGGAGVPAVSWCRRYRGWWWPPVRWRGHLHPGPGTGYVPVAGGMPGPGWAFVPRSPERAKHAGREGHTFPEAIIPAKGHPGQGMF